MKNDFQSQLDRYNSSLDNKIDGAIANYLSGVLMGKETVLEPLVDGFKDIYWLHDFSLEAYTEKWTAKNAKTRNTALSTIQPDYTNLLGFMFWYKDRGTPISYAINTNLGTASLGIGINWSSDIADGATRTSSNYFGNITSNPPLLTLVTDDKGVLIDPVLVDFYGPHYRIYYFGLTLQDNAFYNYHYQQACDEYDAGTITNTLHVKKIPNKTGNFFDLRYYDTDENDISHATDIRIGPQNSEAWSPYYSAYDEVAPTSVTNLASNYLSYPITNLYAPSATQATTDKTKIKNMMIGRPTTFEMPIFFNWKAGGRTSAVGVSPYVDDQLVNQNEVFYFPDWSKWNQKSLNVSLVLPQLLSVDYWGIGEDHFRKGAVNIINDTPNTTLSVPVNTTFKIKDHIKSPVAKYNGNNLSICGGIPIATNINGAGTLKVKLKCEKVDDDITKDPISGAAAYIKFKKTAFDDSVTNNYLKGRISETSDYITFDESQTNSIDIADKTIELEVNKGDNVWLNIDPITLGEHIRIKEMTVTLVSAS